MPTQEREKPIPFVVGPTRQESALPHGAREIRVVDPHFPDHVRLLGAETDADVLFYWRQDARYIPVPKLRLALSLPDRDLKTLLRTRATEQGLTLEAFLRSLTER